MTVSEFVRTLVRLTAGGRAQWRTPSMRAGTKATRVFLAFGKHTFILSPWFLPGGHAQLVEQGQRGELPTVLHSPNDVDALAELVRSRIKAVPRQLSSNDDVPGDWAEIAELAERIMGPEERRRADAEIWRRRDGGNR